MRLTNVSLLVLAGAVTFLFFQLRNLSAEVNRIGKIVDRSSGDEGRGPKNTQPNRPAGNQIEFEGHSYDTYAVRQGNTTLRIYFKDSKGRKLESVKNLKRYLEANSNELVFATNAGMFTSNLDPVGLLVERGEVVSPLNVRD